MPANPETTLAVGFSGTRNGMTAIQAANVAIILRLYAALRHGDCVGSDEQAHDIARELGLWIESHPPIRPVLRAFCTSDVIHPPKGLFTSQSRYRRRHVQDDRDASENVRG